jgi:serine/threonine protein kinase
MTLGTIDYVSPEQIRGEELDGRADLYSLGCILYECLAGRPPFTGSDPAVVFAHLEDDPPALSSADAVVRKALAKDPEDRYQSGRDLVQAAQDQLGLAGRGCSATGSVHWVKRSERTLDGFGRALSPQRSFDVGSPAKSYDESSEPERQRHLGDRSIAPADRYDRIA